MRCFAFGRSVFWRGTAQFECDYPALLAKMPAKLQENDEWVRKIYGQRCFFPFCL